MENKKMNEDLSKIKKKLTEYIELIIKDYGKYMSSEVLNRLRKKNDNFGNNEMVTFNSESTVTFICNNGVLFLPNVYSIFEKIKQEPNFNTKKYILIKSKDYLNTDTTYYDYINYIIECGISVYEYFEESLLHEAMHLCGSGGGLPLEEGINELKTRELAQKYNIKIPAIGYSKEVNIAQKLQKIYGKETMDELAFCDNSLEKVFQFLTSKHGVEKAKIYLFVHDEMAKNNSLSDLYSTFDPYEKARIYSELNYDKINDFFDNYFNEYFNKVKK